MIDAVMTSSLPLPLLALPLEVALDCASTACCAGPMNQSPSMTISGPQTLVACMGWECKMGIPNNHC
jgi:hypothetical protein